MSEPIKLDMDEAIARLTGSTVEVIAAGTDACAMRLEDGTIIAVAICLDCGGHVAYYEIDESMISTGDEHLAS